MTTIKPSNAEYERHLESDLRTLFCLVFTLGEPVSEGDVRIASVILRKWFIEGHLGRYSRSAKLEPRFLALDNSKVLATLPRRKSVDYFLTGGVKFSGVPVMGIYNARRRFKHKPFLPVEQMQDKEFRLGKFLDQRRVYFKGDFFTTEQIIKFTCNKLGGAHYDFHRPNMYRKMEAASEYMTFGGLPTGDESFIGEFHIQLEPESSEVLSAFHIEIIAAATSFIQIRFNGEPFLQVTEHKSIFQKIRELLRPLKSRFRYKNY